MLNLRIIISTCLLVIVQAALGQVNTERLRQEDMKPGFHSRLGLNINLLSGNSQVIQTRASANAHYVKNQHIWFVDVQHKMGSKGDQRFINQGFVHGRWVRTMRKGIQSEVFLQQEYNEFINLQLRQLVGGGLRFKIPQPGAGQSLQGLSMVLGSGFMWEREEMDIGASGENPTPILSPYHSFKLQQLLFNRYTTRVSSESPICSDNPVTRNNDRDRILPERTSHCTRSTTLTYKGSNSSITHCLRLFNHIHF